MIVVEENTPYNSLILVLLSVLGTNTLTVRENATLKTRRLSSLIFKYLKIIPLLTPVGFNRISGCGANIG
jgi:hypothetical protein